MVFDSRNGFQLDDSEIPVSHQLCQKTKIDRSADHHCSGKGILGRWPCAQGSVEPEKPSSRLRCMGNSPGNETGHSLNPADPYPAVHVRPGEQRSAAPSCASKMSFPLRYY